MHCILLNRCNLAMCRHNILDKSFVECLHINLYKGKFDTQGCIVMLIPAVWVWQDGGYGRMASSSQIKYLIYWQDLSGGRYINLVPVGYWPLCQVLPARCGCSIIRLEYLTDIAISNNNTCYIHVVSLLKGHVPYSWPKWPWFSRAVVFPQGEEGHQ